MFSAQTQVLNKSIVEATQQLMSQAQTSNSVSVESLHNQFIQTIELCFSDARYTVLHNLHLPIYDEAFTIKHLVLDSETHHVILFDEMNEINALKIDELGHFLVQMKSGKDFHVMNSPIEKIKRYQQLLSAFLKSMGYVCGSMDYFVLVNDAARLDKPNKGFEHVCYVRELDDQIRCHKKGICGALKLLKSGIRNKWNAQKNKPSEVAAFMSTLQSQS